MSRVLCAVICAGMTIQPAMAASPAAPTLTAASEACARRYNAAIHLEDTMSAMMKSMMPVLISQEEARTGKALTAREKREVVEAIAESAAEFTPVLQERLVPVMAATFTEPELCALADFYETPEGQGVMLKMPAYTRAAGGAMAEVLPLLQGDMMKRVCERLGCDAAAMPTPQPS